MSMNNMSEVEQIELTIEQAKETIELGKALDRLTANKDFRKIVLQGYLEDEAIRLVQIKAEPAMADKESQESIIRGIDSIGILRGYFRIIGQRADMADQALRASEEELTLALEEVSN